MKGRNAVSRTFVLVLMAILFVVNYASAQPGKTFTLQTEADAYVRNGSYAQANYGRATELKTVHSGTDQMEVLLRFYVKNTDRVPDTAFIWIRTAESGTDPVENTAYLLKNDQWNERTVSWETKPEVGAELDAWITDNDHLIKIDVTEAVCEALQGDGRISVLLRSPHDVGPKGESAYLSKEKNKKTAPILVVTFGEPKVRVKPGESIQAALDSIHSQGGGHVVLLQGDHTISESLIMYSDITLCGEGADSTSILLDAEVNLHMLIATSEGDVNHDITIRDLTLNGQQHADEQHYPGKTKRDTIRGDSFGILFTDQDSGNTFERIRVENVEITRCAMGIHMKGVNDLRILNSKIHNNGCLIGYDHNTYFRRAVNTLLKNLNLSDCKAGNGFNLSTECYNLILDNCVASNNNFRGIRFEAGDGGGRFMIINCTANGNGLSEEQPGIRVASVPDFTILNCTANGNGSHGIYCVNSMQGGLIKNNRAVDNAKTNYELQRCGQVEMVNNQ